MEVSSSRARNNDHNLQLQNPPTIINTPKQITVPVVYYLSRNGLLDHPHFILLPLSSSSGLYLRDVINRLTVLRGKAMPSQYSWSSKRSYKNGYVWQDLEENDLIHPVHGGEYVLKGSLILELPSLTSSSNNTSLSKSPETTSSSSTSTAKILPRQRNQSWGGIDLHEYTVYKSEALNNNNLVKAAAAADASTQTDEKRRRSSKSMENEQEELTRDEISPPPSDDSSPETLESLMKADGRLVLSAVDHQVGVDDRTVRECPSGRMKASSVLMSLISCGSISFRDCGVSAIKDHGFTLVSQQHKMIRRLPRGENQTGDGELLNDAMMEVENKTCSSFAKMALEDKEYFSGSLIDTKNDNFVALKRSSSYNDRSSRFKLVEKEEEGVKARCIPRRPKLQAKRECQAQINGVTINTTQDGIYN